MYIQCRYEYRRRKPWSFLLLLLSCSLPPLEMPPKQYLCFTLTDLSMNAILQFALGRERGKRRAHLLAGTRNRTGGSAVRVGCWPAGPCHPYQGPSTSHNPLSRYLEAVHLCCWSPLALAKDCLLSWRHFGTNMNVPHKFKVQIFQMFCFNLGLSVAD